VLQRLSEVGAERDDLYEVIEESFTSMGRGFRTEGSAEGFRLKEIDKAGRTIWVKINKGPAGIEGEAFDIDTNESIETTERQALLSGLRAMFVIPKDSFYGLLFIERIGRRNLREVLENWIIKPSSHHLGESLVRIEGFAEASDWRSILADKELLRVSEVLKSTDSGQDASTADDRVVNISVSGTAVRRGTERMRDMIANRASRRENRVDLVAENSRLEEKKHRAEADAFTVQDEAALAAVTEALARLDTSLTREDSLASFLAELTPDAGEGLEHHSYDVTIGERHPERVFSVERDSIPQFVYELGTRRLTDVEMRALWIDHAGTILTNRGVTLPRGWALKGTPIE